MFDPQPSLSNPILPLTRLAMYQLTMTASYNKFHQGVGCY